MTLKSWVLGRLQRMNGLVARVDLPAREPTGEPTRGSAQHAGSDDLKKLEAIHDRMAALREAGDTAGELLEAERFHMAVYALAGMPVLSKPATSSAMVAHRVMQIIVEKKLLPEGALSFLVGAARDLVAHLGPQDVLAFTGSGDTGEKIRSAPNVIRHCPRSRNRDCRRG